MSQPIQKIAVSSAAGQPSTRHIPQARFVELDGHDHWVFAGDQQQVLENVRQFITGLAG